VTEFGDHRPAHGAASVTSRRTVLRAAGLLALTCTGAAGLAGCSPAAETGAPLRNARRHDISHSFAVADRRRDFPQTVRLAG
jgi:hypothetical protein